MNIQSFQPGGGENSGVEFRSGLASFSMRVTTLPRISTMFRSERSASNCDLRRVLLVATVAPWGRSLMASLGLNPRRAISSGEMLGVAINQNITHVGALADGTEVSPVGNSVGKSFRLCTREIGFMVQQSDFEFLGEKTFWQTYRLPWPSRLFATCRQWS